jgi:hypothetical protein
MNNAGSAKLRRDTTAMPKKSLSYIIRRSVVQADAARFQNDGFIILPFLNVKEMSERKIVCSSGFKVPSSGFKVPSSGFKVQGSKFRVQSSKFRVQSSKFRVQR